MPLRALLYRRPSEPQAIEVVFDRSIYLVRLRRHRQARRYTLRIHAATREVILTIPMRGSLKEARDFVVAHHIVTSKANKLDPLDRVQDLAHRDQARLLLAWEIHLGHVARHDHF